MRPLLTVLITALMISAALADHTCNHGSGAIDRRVDKYQTGYIDFVAESRVERFTATARQFIWCITNIHQYHVGQFKWGTAAEEDRYFSAIVEPGRESQVLRTDSSDIRMDSRLLKFRRLNSAEWQQIKPETIFFERLGDRFDKPQLAQLSPSAPIRTEDDLLKLNFDELSRGDLSTLRAGFARDPKIQFYASVTATIPANVEAKKAIENQSYDGYRPEDFARITVSLVNRLEANRAPEPLTSAVSVELYAVDPRAPAALRQVPVRVRIEPAHRMLPQEFVVASINHRFDARVRIERLAHVDLLVTVAAADSNYVFATLPVQLLLPTTPQ